MNKIKYKERTYSQIQRNSKNVPQNFICAEQYYKKNKNLRQVSQKIEKMNNN